MDDKTASVVQSSYNDLWRSKLQDEDWLKNDGRGRVEYAVKLIKPCLTDETRILDIGCGRGTLGIWLNRKQGMFGVDIAPEAIAATSEVYERAEICNIDGDPLPFEDNFFDFCVFLDVIEHLFDPRVILREILRVLKPRGQMILSTPNILAHVEKLVKTRRFPKTSCDPVPGSPQLHRAGSTEKIHCYTA